MFDNESKASSSGGDQYPTLNSLQTCSNHGNSGSPDANEKFFECAPTHACHERRTSSGSCSPGIPPLSKADRFGHFLSYMTIVKYPKWSWCIKLESSLLLCPYRTVLPLLRILVYMVLVLVDYSFAITCIWCTLFIDCMMNMENQILTLLLIFSPFSNKIHFF